MLTETIDYKAVFDSVDELIFLFEENLNLISFNQSAKEKLLLDPPQGKNFSVADLIGQNRWNDLVSSLKDRRFPSNYELTFSLKNGKKINTLAKVKTIRNGEKQFYVFVFTDITEEKKEHLELIRFSNALNKAKNPIQITDENGLMVYVNPAFEQSSGYKKEELLGKNPSILSSRKMSKEFWEKVWNTVLSGKVWSGQIENKRKDGSPLYVDSIISPIIDDKGKAAGYLAVHKIITDFKTLEQHLVCAQRLGSMGILAAGIAHEIGNPLASISSIAQLIERSTEDVFLKEKLGNIKRQIYRIANIIRQLVEFSNPSVHSPKPVSINRLIISSVNIVKMGTGSSDIVFDVELGNDLPKLHLVSEDLMQVVLNLLLNSVESLTETSGKITVKALRVNDHLEIVITDTGKGITKENLKRIFEPFFTTKAGGAGIGLGLWVSYGIIRNMGGDILVESSANEGSKFTILLPINNR